MGSKFIRTQSKSIAQKLRDAGYTELENNDTRWFTFINDGEDILSKEDKRFIDETDLLFI